MNSSSLRLATLAALVNEVEPHRGLGRTAVMKLTYFLQTLEGMPLGYDFRIYTYGPYDVQVLEDLKIAELVGAVVSHEYAHSYGYGYKIVAGEMVDRIIHSEPKIADHKSSVAWVVSEFGSRTAIDLEMVSTIVFIDRASFDDGENLTTREIATRVKSIKPRLNLNNVENEAEALKAKSFLKSVN